MKRRRPALARRAHRKSKTAHIVGRFHWACRQPGRQTSAAFSTSRVATQFLVLEIGRLSTISITSPVWNSPFSSWAWYLLDLATILPYSSCLTRRSTRTVTVLARLSLTTLPTKVRLRDVLASVMGAPYLAAGVLADSSACFWARMVLARAMSR